jgi:hypothetical protein
MESGLFFFLCFYPKRVLPEGGRVGFKVTGSGPKRALLLPKVGTKKEGWDTSGQCSQTRAPLPA